MELITKMSIFIISSLVRNLVKSPKAATGIY